MDTLRAFPSSSFLWQMSGCFKCSTFQHKQTNKKSLNPEKQLQKKMHKMVCAYDAEAEKAG